VAGHTCALTPAGEAWCWGWNGAGQLGDGTTTSSLVPVAVAGGLRFNSLSLGGTASCGRRANRVWCWGGNQFGQLGIGSLVNTSLPTLVNSPFDVP
jgi:alpha-tubulin suppressor-like RCC1 family protein